jgi:hypothetical protein
MMHSVVSIQISGIGTGRDIVGSGNTVMTALVGCRVGAAGVIGWESVVGFGGTSEGLLEDSFILGVVVEAAGRRRYGWRYLSWDSSSSLQCIGNAQVLEKLE